jgi:hypothetical protein
MEIPARRRLVTEQLLHVKEPAGDLIPRRTLSLPCAVRTHQRDANIAPTI